MSRSQPLYHARPVLVALLTLLQLVTMYTCVQSSLQHLCRTSVLELTRFWGAAAAAAAAVPLASALAEAEAAGHAALQLCPQAHCGHHVDVHRAFVAGKLALAASSLLRIPTMRAANCFATSTQPRCHHYHTVRSSSSGSSHQHAALNSQPDVTADAAGGLDRGGVQLDHNCEHNSASRRSNSTGRFYNTVTVVPCSSAAQDQQHTAGSQQGPPNQGYQLLLRSYPIKTPAKNLLVLPTYSLALAVAAEWEWLPKGKPIAHLMPLTSLAATAIDQPRERPKVIEHLMKYIHTDSACIRYEPGPLQRRQAKLFDPLLHWVREELGWQLHATDSIAGTTQPPATVEAAHQYLQGLDRWQLAAAEQLTTASKSLVIAAAVLHGKTTSAEAVAAARVEEEFQLEDWGVVEAGHDLDIVDTNTRIGAPAVFHKLLSQP